MKTRIARYIVPPDAPFPLSGLLEFIMAVNSLRHVETFLDLVHLGSAHVTVGPG